MDSLSSVTPLEFRLTVPSTSVPVEKVTWPVGVPMAPLADRLTVAVKVTFAGGVTVDDDAVSVVEVGAEFSVTI